MTCAQLALPQFQAFTTAIGVAGGVLTVPYSITYDELSYAIDDTIPVANLQSFNGDFVSPYVTNASVAAIDSISLDPVTNAAEIANLPTTSATLGGVYPFLTLGYLILDTNFNQSSCELQREVLKVVPLSPPPLDPSRLTTNPRSSSAGR